MVVVQWVNSDGDSFYARLPLGGDDLPHVQRGTARNAALGVHGCIDFRLDPKEQVSLWDCLYHQRRRRDALFNPIAAFPLVASGEVLIVESNGQLSRVAWPLRPGPTT